MSLFHVSSNHVNRNGQCHAKENSFQIEGRNWELLRTTVSHSRHVHANRSRELPTLEELSYAMLLSISDNLCIGYVWQNTWIYKEDVIYRKTWTLTSRYRGHFSLPFFVLVIWRRKTKLKEIFSYKRTDRFRLLSKEIYLLYIFVQWYCSVMYMSSYCTFCWNTVHHLEI